MSNLPDNMDWAAYDAHYGTGDERGASQAAWDAAALYYLALAFGLSTDALGDDVDEALSDDGFGRDEQAFEDAWDDFRDRYKDNPLAAAADLLTAATRHERRKLRDDARRAVIAFIAGLNMGCDDE